MMTKTQQQQTDDTVVIKTQPKVKSLSSTDAENAMIGGRSVKEIVAAALSRHTIVVDRDGCAEICLNVKRNTWFFSAVSEVALFDECSHEYLHCGEEWTMSRDLDVQTLPAFAAAENAVYERFRYRRNDHETDYIVINKVIFESEDYVVIRLAVVMTAHVRALQKMNSDAYIPAQYCWRQKSFGEAF